MARTQRIGGVDFSYQPPPRHIVPYAASLKGQGSARWAAGLCVCEYSWVGGWCGGG